MNTVRFRRNALSLAVMVACAGQAHAATYTWLGADGDFATGSNWQGGTAPTNLTDATLLFNATTVGTGEKTITNALASTPTYYALQFTGGDFTLGENQIALRPYATPGPNYYTQVLSSSGGNNTISAPLQINPNSANWILSEEALDWASIGVSSGSLTLSGEVAASLVRLTTNVSSGATLNLDSVSVSAKSFTANGGSQNLTGALNSSGAVTISGSDFTVGGSAGSITAGSGTAVSLASSTSKLTLDNTAHASDARLAGNVAMSAGSTLLLKGNATNAVDETAGNLTVTGSSTGLTHVKVEGAGADASLTFSSLSHNSGILNFASTGVLGNAERIKFTAAPTTVDGLMSRSLVNAQEFARYDTTQGVMSATSATTLAGATAADNVFVTATENVTNSGTINSLAVKDATITSSGANSLALASGKLLTTGTTNIAPAINFGSTAGQIINFGTAVLAGGVNGSNGLSVLGSGSLEMQSAGTLTGNFSHTGQVILSANDALLGASVTTADMNIGSTTQHFQSLSGSNLTGNGSIVATSSIALYQAEIYASLQGQTVTIGAGTTAYNTIQASQNVSLGTLSTVNNVISGAADVSVSSPGYGAATLTQQNTYTGSTTGTLLLTGNGSIAESSAFTSYSQGSLGMLVSDADNGALNRIGNSADVTLNNGALALLGTGTSVVVNEDIGDLVVGGASRLVIGNSTSGSTSLRADSLQLGSGASLTMALGNASSFYLDAGPGLYTGTNVVRDVYVEKTINGGQLPSWAAYNTGTGRVSEALVAEKSLNTATSNEFVRVTNAVNSAMNSSRSVGGVNIDTNQTMTGTGTLTVGSGQLLFWKDNTVALSGLNFGAQQGVVINAGTNTISSVISGSNGLRKVGDGTLVLTGQNTYTGITQVADGKLDVNGGRVLGTVDVGSGASLELRNGGVATLANNSGTVDLRDAYTNSATRTITGDGTINAHSGLTNQGVIHGTVSSAASINNSGTLVTADVNGAGTLSNSGTIYSLNYSSSNTFTNNGTVSDLDNSATVVNASNGTVNKLINTGTFTNNGTLMLDYASLAGTVTNAGGTATLSAGASASGSGYIQSNGTTTIDGLFFGDMQLNGGNLKGSGRLYGNLTVTGGTINPGNSPGLFTVEGNVTLGVGSTLNLEVTSLGGQWAYDKLIVTGAFDKLGAINFSLGAGVSFADGKFALAGQQSLGFESIFGYGLLASLAGEELMVGGQSFILTEDFIPQPPQSTSAVPVPGALWLLSSGLLGLLGVARRNSKPA